MHYESKAGWLDERQTDDDLVLPAFASFACFADMFPLCCLDIILK